MPKLDHFKASEFGLWWLFMNHEQLACLDRFRELWGYPVVISPAKGGIGRAIESGEGFHSAHNLLKWGSIKATDFFPMVPDGPNEYKYIDSVNDLERAHQVAIDAGFEGIGLYTDTKPGFMVHGDVAGEGRRWARVPTSTDGDDGYRAIEAIV